MPDILDGVTWFRQSSVRIRRDGLEIHIDPWGVRAEGKADYILLTHPHYDNFSEEDIAKLRTPDTVLVAPASMRKQLQDVDHLLRPGDLIQLDRIDILAVPAHNKVRKFHTPEAGWLGYVFSVGDVTYYHAGHSDLLDSMKGIRCDVAFLPCCADYTMAPDEVVAAGEACGASVIVPIHWGDQADHSAEVKKMAGLFSGEVRPLERNA
jgi:L-ascorbate metabolism protein UlaG (beta-lactamase superfamily)